MTTSATPRIGSTHTTFGRPISTENRPVSTRGKAFYKTKWFNLAVGLAVTAACLWWAFQQMLKGDNGKKSPSEVIGEIVAAFRQADYRSLPAMWAALFCSIG